MDIMNVLRTGMNMAISRIHIWLYYNIIISKSELKSHYRNHFRTNA